MRLGDQGLDVLAAGVCIDLEGDADRREAVADIRVHAEDAADVDVALDDGAGFVFLLNNDGDLIVARTTRTGFTQVTRYEVSDSATWAQPTISGNRLFIKDESHVTLWTVE